MDRVLAIVAYFALDLILGAISRKVLPLKPGYVPGIWSLMAFGIVSLPFPFLQFWVLTHEMLWQQYLIIAVLGLIGSVGSVLFLRSFGLATKDKRSKLGDVGFIRGRDNLVGTGLAGLLALIFVIGALVVVPITYIRNDYHNPDFLAMIAVTHFTVRGLLLLSSSILVQIALLAGYLDSDVRTSTVLSQMLGFIGGVYSICLPIFLFSSSELKRTILWPIADVPAWEVFAVLLLAYLFLWLALYFVGSFRTELTLLSFPEWAQRWSNQTRAGLSDVADKRRASIFTQARLLLEKLRSSITSEAVADYLAWRDAKLFADLPQALRDQQAPEALIAAAGEIETAVAARPGTLDDVFERHRDDIASLDGRLEQADELLTYLFRLLAYLRGELDPGDFDHFLAVSAEGSWRQLQLYPEERRMTRRMVTFAGAASGVFVGAANIFERLHLHLP